MSLATAFCRKQGTGCGRVAKASGAVLIGKGISHSFEKDSSYHKPLRKVTSRDDVEYDPNMMLRVRRTIAVHVKNGHPVLVGCAFDPKTSMLKDGHLQATRDGWRSHGANSWLQRRRLGN
jgi:hypothetical protein